MNRLDASVDAARRAMTAAGELPRGLVPNKERIETDQFVGEIYFNNDPHKAEWVAKLVPRNSEDRGCAEMVRAASKDELMAELLRHVGALETQSQDLSFPRSKVHMRLADYDSPNAMLDDVIQSAAARQWLQTPVGQQYSRLERVCLDSRVFEIWKHGMEELGYWEDPALWTVPNLNHAFILGFDRGDYKCFERKADTQSANVNAASGVEKDAEYEEDAKSPFLHMNTNAAQPDKIQTDRQLPLSELRRKAYAQRFANRQSR
jgi:hypothetical protein